MQTLEKQPITTFISPSNQPKPKGNFRLLISLLIGIILLALIGVVIYTPNGEPEILPDRKKKLEDDLQKLENAEQYALIAQFSGLYPCPSCPDQDSIFLLKGEIWKYGYTINGAEGRGYSQTFFRKTGLRYIVQFRGNVGACMAEEKIKIYHYPTLPENLKRQTKLLRPPGNKEDR